MGQEFNVGGTVQLICGGAFMVIQALRGKNNDYAECV